MNGLTLLAPAGLLALAALALPVLIHLFSRSKGRRVLVGNIDLYRQAKRQRVTELRPVQWWLLLLRLALLALAALLLAGLARSGLDSLDGDTAYLTPEWQARASANDRQALADFDHVHLLAPGYPDPALTGEPPPAGADPWSLLAERLATVRHGGEVHLFAGAEAAQFPARAPALDEPLNWHFLAAPAVAPQPVSLRVRIAHATDRGSDAEMLAAALEAAARHRNIALDLARTPLVNDGANNGADEGAELARQDPGIDLANDVLVWLGSGPAPTGLAASLVLEDRPAGGFRQPARATTWPHARWLAAPAEAADSRNAEGFSTIWRTGDGSPLLQERNDGGQRHLVLRERLSPGPDALAGQPAFPDTLLRLLLGEATWAVATSTAPADPTAAVARPAPAGTQPHRPLAPWLALAMAVLFGLERWLAERPRRDPASSTA